MSKQRSRPAAQARPGHPGARLGLPKEGSGAVAGYGRRLGAILVDWMVCVWAIAGGLLQTRGQEQAVIGLAAFAVEYVLLVGTLGMTLGMRLFGIRVAALDGGRPPLIAVLIRTFLMFLVVPALFYDEDRRGLHDRAANTVVVNL